MININKKAISYISLIFVVLVWGSSPLFTLHLYKYYSPTIRVCFSEFVLVITYLILSKKYIKEYNLNYIKAGIATGFFLSLANISQKIGLLYTTPAKYAFLENLSCITVPVLMYVFTKKKPKITTVAVCVLCLISAFILNGMSFSKTTFGIGEILCSISGLLYGFNIAGTAVFAKKLHTTLYLATQSATSFIISLTSSVLLNWITIPSANAVQIPLEQIRFSFKPTHIIAVILQALICSALCWILRTRALKYIDASIVAVIMPFSAAITSVLSVIAGTDTFSMNLLFGVLLGLSAIMLSKSERIFRMHRT